MMNLLGLRKNQPPPVALSGFQACVFDLDGTLVDSIGEITASCNAALWSLEKRPPFPPQTYAQMADKGDAILIARLLTAADERAAGSMAPVSAALQTADPAKLDARRLADFAAAKTKFEDEAFEAGEAPVKAFPGAFELRRSLNDREIPIAVLSNKRKEAVVRTCAEVFEGISFVAVEGAVEGAPAPKPSPQALLDIIRSFGLPAASVAMIGDTMIDMQAGKAAGAVCVGVTYGFRSGDELTENGADRLFNSARDLRIALDCDAEALG